VADIKAVIFDIGNTLFYISIEQQIQYWAQSTGLPFHVINNRFSFDDTHKQFERGEITELDYYEHIKQLLQTPSLTFEQYFNGWNAIYCENLPLIEQVIHQIKQQGIKVVALSNTNITHEKIWKWKYKSLLFPFDKVFASHHIGTIKPEQEAYFTVLNYLNLTPKQCLFFDDSAINIKAAQELGINAHQVVTPKGMYMEMLEMGIDLQF